MYWKHSATLTFFNTDFEPFWMSKISLPHNTSNHLNLTRRLRHKIKVKYFCKFCSLSIIHCCYCLLLFDWNCRINFSKNDLFLKNKNFYNWRNMINFSVHEIHIYYFLLLVVHLILGSELAYTSDKNRMKSFQCCEKFIKWFCTVKKKLPDLASIYLKYLNYGTYPALTQTIRTISR